MYKHIYKYQLYKIHKVRLFASYVGKLYKYIYSTHLLGPRSIYTYNFKSVAEPIKQNYVNYINFIAQTTMLYINIYIKNKYMDYIRLGY